MFRLSRTGGQTNTPSRTLLLKKGHRDKADDDAREYPSRNVVEKTEVARAICPGKVLVRLSPRDLSQCRSTRQDGALALGAVSGPYTLSARLAHLQPASYTRCRPAEPPLGASAAETPLNTSCRQGKPPEGAAPPLIVSHAHLRVKFQLNAPLNSKNLEASRPAAPPPSPPPGSSVAHSESEIDHGYGWHTEASVGVVPLCSFACGTSRSGRRPRHRRHRCAGRRPHRRAHQRLKARPLWLPRHAPPHPRPPVTRQTDGRLPLRAIPATGSGCRAKICSRAREDAANARKAGGWKGAAGVCPGQGVCRVAGGLWDRRAVDGGVS